MSGPLQITLAHERGLDTHRLFRLLLDNGYTLDHEGYMPDHFYVLNETWHPKREFHGGDTSNRPA